MTDLPDHRLDRRQFGLSTLTIGAAALTSKLAQAQDKPAQASGPIVLAGVSPRLTIHALDTFHGAAATGLSVDFSMFDGKDYVQVKSLKMNGNGRSDEPVLIGETYKAGKYEFLLHVDDYFAMKGAKLPTPPFLSKVPIRFQIVNIEERIHLPIQFGPWSYQYSRGS